MLHEGSSRHAVAPWQADSHTNAYNRRLHVNIGILEAHTEVRPCEAASLTSDEPITLEIQNSVKSDGEFLFHTVKQKFAVTFSRNFNDVKKKLVTSSSHAWVKEVVTSLIACMGFVRNVRKDLRNDGMNAKS